MNTNKQLKELAVRIRKDTQNIGTGLLFIPPSRDQVLVLTAAHVADTFDIGEHMVIQCYPMDDEPCEFSFKRTRSNVICSEDHEDDPSRDVALIYLPRAAQRQLENRAVTYLGEPAEGLRLEAFSFSGNSEEESVRLDVLPITPEGSYVINCDTRNHMIRVMLQGAFAINHADRVQEVEGWSGTVLMASGQEHLIAVGILVQIPGVNGLNGTFGAADTTFLQKLLTEEDIGWERIPIVTATQPEAPAKLPPADLTCTAWWTGHRLDPGKLWFDDRCGVALSNLLLCTAGKGVFFLSSCIEGSFADALNLLAEQHDLPGCWMDASAADADILTDTRSVIITIREESSRVYDQLTSFVRKWKHARADRQLLVHFCCDDPYTSIRASRQAASNLCGDIPIQLLTTLDPFSFRSDTDRIHRKTQQFLVDTDLRAEQQFRKGIYDLDLQKELCTFLFEGPECSCTLLQSAADYPRLLSDAFSLAASSHRGCRTLLRAMGPEKVFRFLDSDPWFDTPPDWRLLAWELQKLSGSDPNWSDCLELVLTHLEEEDRTVLCQLADAPSPELLAELDPGYLRFWMEDATPERVSALGAYFRTHLSPGFLCLLFGSASTLAFLSNKIKNEKIRMMYASILIGDGTGAESDDVRELRASIFGR